LDTKKERLFSQGLGPSWGVNQSKVPQELISKNKLIGKFFMLPKETKNLKNYGKIFGYFNSQLLAESNFCFESRAKRYIQAFTEFCNCTMEVYGGVRIWIFIREKFYKGIFIDFF
jgi:hypothetical protein